MQSLQRCHWPLAVQSHHRVLSLVFKHVFAVYIFLLRVIIRAAAAAFHLMLHSAGGLHIFDQASRPAVDTVAGCSSQPNGSQHLNHVMTEFALY